jgi:ammonia channel protein AmtB
MNLRHPVVIGIAVVAGIALIVLACVYWAEPAGSLPSWIPGHETGSAHHHVKHGIAAFLVGVALLVFAWFQTGPRASAASSS